MGLPVAWITYSHQVAADQAKIRALLNGYNVMNNSSRTLACRPPCLAQWIVLDVVIPQLHPCAVVTTISRRSAFTFPALLRHQL